MALIAYTGYLEWCEQEACWVIVDLQGATMPDVWPESQRLETGSTFFRWDEGEREWAASRIILRPDGQWEIEGTDLRGSKLEGLLVKQDYLVDPLACGSR